MQIYHLHSELIIPRLIWRYQSFLCERSILGDALFFPISFAILALVSCTEDHCGEPLPLKIDSWTDDVYTQHLRIVNSISE
jgi:hypothetical protein